MTGKERINNILRKKSGRSVCWTTLDVGSQMVRPALGVHNDPSRHGGLQSGGGQGKLHDDVGGRRHGSGLLQRHAGHPDVL